MEAKRWTLGVVLAAAVSLFGLIQADASPFSTHILTDDLGNRVHASAPEQSEWDTDPGSGSADDDSGTDGSASDGSGSGSSGSGADDGSGSSDTSGKDNNGHGNNVDGVDSSNSGNSSQAVFLISSSPI